MTTTASFEPPALRTVLARCLALVAAVALVGCDKQPTGQVAAVIDGEEITEAEINLELGEMQPPPGADRKAIQRAALQRLVDRRLLANGARQDGLDQTPEFILRQKQLDEALLVQMLTHKMGRSVKMPSDAEVDQFIAKNPNMFANRTVLNLDQIAFTPPAQDTYLKSLAGAHSMAEVEAVLKQFGIKFQRRSTQLDTAQVPVELVKKIEALPSGEPFVIPAGGAMSVNVITGSKTVPTSASDARPVAVAAARNRMLGEQVDQRLKSERVQSKVVYQAGFAPPAAAKDLPRTATSTP